MSLSNIQFIIIIHSDSSFKNEWQIWEHFADLPLISGEMPLIIWMIFVTLSSQMRLRGLGSPEYMEFRSNIFKVFVDKSANLQNV